MTGDIIKSIAAKLWVRLNDYAGQPLPPFSSGWLDGFKSRYSFRRFRQHGEACAALQVDCTEDLQALQVIINEYESNDIYNADETGLFWRSLPNTTLATQPQSGGKSSKSRITVLPCSNASGSHRLDLWLIGSAANPRVFGRNNIRISMHPIHYRSNKTAWMTGKIFLEWLRWFDNQMTGRKVLLLLDNFSAHTKAVVEAEEEGILRHTRVVFLPANTTSLHQPMDQGIINNLKVYYKRHWLEFVANAFFHDRDPLKEVTLLRAVGWLVDAWREGIKEDTINACWVKSQLFGSFNGPAKRPADWNESREAIRELLTQTRIRQLMRLDHITDLDEATLDAFIDPVEERVFDTDDDDLDRIAAQFSSAPAEDEDDDLDRLLPPIISIAEASDAFVKLINFQEQQEIPDFLLLQSLYRQHRAFLHQTRMDRDNAKQQQSIDKYLITALGAY